SAAAGRPCASAARALSAGLLRHAAVPSVPVDLPSTVRLLVERHVGAMVQMLAVGGLGHPAARLEGEVTETRDVSEGQCVLGALGQIRCKESLDGCGAGGGFGSGCHDLGVLRVECRHSSRVSRVVGVLPNLIDFSNLATKVR